MKKPEFNVIVYDINSGDFIPYNVLPYFRHVWKDKKWDIFNKSSVKNKMDLKSWIKDASRYMYWARCEYELLLCPWPYNDTKDMMKKIDVHKQIMNNIDLITDILYNEFFKNKKSKKK